MPIFNKNSPWAHTESEFDVLGVHGKLVKYVVHLCKETSMPNPKLAFKLKHRIDQKKSHQMVFIFIDHICTT
jgi:hypothetical protein